MTAAPFTCPFCNSELPLEPADHRCPRCGEQLPLHDRSTAGSLLDDRIDAEMARHRLARQAKAKRSTRIAIIFAVALGAAGIGLGLHLSRTGCVFPERTVADTARAVAPEEMPGLLYLPSGTDSVIAFQLVPFTIRFRMPKGTTPNRLGPSSASLLKRVRASNERRV